MLRAHVEYAAPWIQIPFLQALSDQERNIKWFGHITLEMEGAIFEGLKQAILKPER